jgi:hypothetical protein
VAVVTLGATLAYDLVMILLKPALPVLFHTATALSLLGVLLWEELHLRSKLLTLRAVGSQDPKLVLIRDSHAQRLYREYEENTVCSDSASTLQLFRVARTDGFENFDRRMDKRSLITPLYTYLLPPLLTLCAVLAITTHFAGADGEALCNAFLLTFTVCSPLSLGILTEFLYYRLLKRMVASGAVLIGQSSAEEYRSADALLFSDEYLFPAEDIANRGLKLYDGHSLYEVVSCANALFTAIGGPMRSVFASAEDSQTDRPTEGDRTVSRVEFSENGVSAVIGQKDRILIGDREYLRSHRISIPRDAEDEAIAANGVFRVQYFVLNRHPCARIYVNYALNPGFELLCATLARLRVASVVDTRDPNVREDLLKRKFRPGAPLPEILRNPDPLCDDRTHETVSSGIAVRYRNPGSVRQLSIPFLAIRKLLQYRESLYRYALCGLIVNLLLMAAVCMSGLSLYLLPVFAVLYQVLWSLPILAVAHPYFGTPRRGRQKTNS